jgi:hypothetical protein
MSTRFGGTLFRHSLLGGQPLMKRTDSIGRNGLLVLYVRLQGLIPFSWPVPL